MFKWTISVVNREEGATLVEVIAAIWLLAIVGTIFLMAILIATKSIMIADERTNAESLARAQMEYVKQQEYIYNDVEAEYLEIDLSGTTYIDGTPYTISSVDRAGITTSLVLAVPWNSQTDSPALTDLGLQKIILKIFHGDNNEVLTLEGYKVDAGVY